VALFLCLDVATSRDNGQWEEMDPKVRAWYQGLMQPDNPTVSCCGEADAYHADDFSIDPATGDTIATITDTRPPCDGTEESVEAGCVPNRPHLPPGTRVRVPKSKMKWDRGNPTGHGVIFVSTSLSVYCYVTPAGI